MATAKGTGGAYGRVRPMAPASGEAPAASDPGMPARPGNETRRLKALGYIRVSTAEQVNGFGLDVQEKAIRAFSKANGIRLVGVHRDEGASGSNGLDSRVGLAEALARLKAGYAELLVVYRMDRLARDLLLQETLVQRLRDQGTPVRSASEPDLDTDTDDPTKVLIRQIIGAVSQYERAVIRGRMMAGKAAKREAGGYVGGGVVLGKRVVGRELVNDDDEQRAVERMVELRRGGASFRKIAQALDDEGFKTKHGNHWADRPATVRRAVLRHFGEL